MQKLGDFKLPHFFNYPPYFTLQPVRETREKQVQLWKDLILDYCRTQKLFIIGLEEEFPLFSNPVIERTLSHEAREAFFSALVSEGRAEWLDKGHRKCLILWHRIQDWAGIILNFVKDNGFEDSVMTVEEIRSGIESRGTVLGEGQTCGGVWRRKASISCMCPGNICRSNCMLDVLINVSNARRVDIL
ncbi:PREDICTED: vacuolar protein sorting-associated protein 25 isoform X1 [Theobroma cacao]|uniref:Vacuolar protein sorting-associated protein 25 isoform X1 n=1 Tax=Theobroma cacao TaxID=3641 RepID=A0AB32W0F5_THECC|nr:PREDICTED: vacuolar protein sorting-associated protein 25 isoform X1 [Theobroma cacao]XP_017972292.1 PREDICTED: vacuolar protein sorting-associated protein 25 isoform X1 [Theobroma cacao]